MVKGRLGTTTFQALAQDRARLQAAAGRRGAKGTMTVTRDPPPPPGVGEERGTNPDPFASKAREGNSGHPSVVLSSPQQTLSSPDRLVSTFNFNLLLMCEPA